MPGHGHGGGGHGGHGHGGHIPRTGFANWNYQPPQTVIVERPAEIPESWLWIGGGVLAGMLLALLTRNR